jgi:hypothetical protein
MTVVAIRGTPEVALGAAGTISVFRAPSGTALNAGAAIHLGSFDANGTPATDQILTVSVTSLSAGDRLGLISTGANWLGGSGIGVITVFVQ